MNRVFNLMLALGVSMVTALSSAAQNTSGQPQTTSVEDTIVVQDSVFRWASLVDMCEKFPTDKCAQGHNFIETYEKLFSPLRDSMERFFEIGILNGVSHLMWREYFKNEEIFGIDINDYSEKSRGTGIETFVADQSNRDDLQAFINTYGSNFDVFIGFRGVFGGSALLSIYIHER